MASAFSHAIAAVAIGKISKAVGWPKEIDQVDTKFWWLLAFCGAIPDIDAIGYWRGVSYDSVWGHRGITHSLFFAAQGASFYEGFGMPIIEAQSVGRPVITGNIGAMKEVGDGSTILVDPYNVSEIKDAISLLISDRKLYDDMVGKGYENAAKYNYKRIAAEYLEVYKELAVKNK